MRARINGVQLQYYYLVLSMISIEQVRILSNKKKEKKKTKQEKKEKRKKVKIAVKTAIDINPRFYNSFE